MSQNEVVTTEVEHSRVDWVAEHTRSYLASGGAEGHIVDVRVLGGHQFTTTLLLRTVGRKTQQVRVAPLIYGDIGGEVVIVASKGGADVHPAWYFNIKDSKEVQFQVATQAFRGGWREPDGAEREEIWAFMEKIYPPYKDYQKATRRKIPLVMLAPHETIEVFRA